LTSYETGSAMLNRIPSGLESDSGHKDDSRDRIQGSVTPVQLIDGVACGMHGNGSASA
jgi:hypothetical protein